MALRHYSRVAIVEFFDAHWFPLKGNREVIRDFSLRETGGFEANADEFHDYLINLVRPRMFVTNRSD